MKKIADKNINTVNYWNNLLEDGMWGIERGDIYKKLFRYFPKKRKITAIDIGCAMGHGLIELANKLGNVSFEGCDFSEKGIKKAKKLYGKKIRFFVHDIYKDALDKRYDYISFVETLEHIKNPKKIIKKYLGFCNERMLVTVPHKEGKWKEHLYSFDEDSFSDVKELKNYFIFRKLNTNQRIILFIFEK